MLLSQFVRKGFNTLTLVSGEFRFYAKDFLVLGKKIKFFNKKADWIVFENTEIISKMGEIFFDTPEGRVYITK